MEIGELQVYIKHYEDEKRVLLIQDVPLYLKEEEVEHILHKAHGPNTVIIGLGRARNPVGNKMVAGLPNWWYTVEDALYYPEEITIDFTKCAIVQKGQCKKCRGFNHYAKNCRKMAVEFQPIREEKEDTPSPTETEGEEEESFGDEEEEEQESVQVGVHNNPGYEPGQETPTEETHTTDEEVMFNMGPSNPITHMPSPTSQQRITDTPRNNPLQAITPEQEHTPPPAQTRESSVLTDLSTGTHMTNSSTSSSPPEGTCTGPRSTPRTSSPTRNSQEMTQSSQGTTQQEEEKTRSSARIKELETKKREEEAKKVALLTRKEQQRIWQQDGYGQYIRARRNSSPNTSSGRRDIGDAK